MLQFALDSYSHSKVGVYIGFFCLYSFKTLATSCSYWHLSEETDKRYNRDRKRYPFGSCKLEEMSETAYEKATRELKTNPKANRIGYYETENAVGEGNFAQVKIATHVVTGEKVGYLV